MDEFEKGQKYEQLKKSSWDKISLGYGLLSANLLIPFAYWDFMTKIIGIGLFNFIALICLWLGYSEKKEMKKYLNGMDNL